MSAVCVADVGVATLYLVVCTKLVVSDVYTVDLALLHGRISGSPAMRTGW